MTTTTISGAYLDARTAELASSITRSLADGATTGDVAVQLGLALGETDDGESIVLLPGWVADDGECPVYSEEEAAINAAEEYVEGGDWGEVEETIFIKVHTYRAGYGVRDGEVFDDSDRNSQDTHTVTIDPDEPGCEGTPKHDWQSPHEIVGGDPYNPGVRGHGGGVICTEVCVRCGCARITDTWATSSADGTQGHTTVRYEPDFCEIEDEDTNLTTR